MEDTVEMKVLYMVANAGFADDVIEIAREAGVKGATILNARGEGSQHESFMGITLDTEKEMIFCIVDGNTAKKAMAAIQEKAGIKTPAHCICFTMPVDNAVGVNISVPQA